MLPLFPAEAPAFRVALTDKVKRAADRGVLFGTSSWKFEGWLGQIYTAENYVTRGKFSRKQFLDQCLAEYAEVFPVVCGDFTFYQFPTPESWQSLFAASDRLQFAFKVPEEITVRVWPNHARYGERAALDNPCFLDTRLFQTSFLDVLEPYRDRVTVLIFEFGTFPRGLYEREEDFVMDLDRFLGELPKHWRYAVEIRNPEFLGPWYLASLADHGVAHLFNAWTRMPTIAAQMEIPGVFTTDLVVSRAQLRQGRSYEQAQSFEPFSKIEDPNPETREALRMLARRAVARGEKAYLFANNGLEGNAPGTIDAVLADLIL